MSVILIFGSRSTPVFRQVPVTTSLPRASANTKAAERLIEEAAVEPSGCRAVDVTPRVERASRRYLSRATDGLHAQVG